MRRLLPLALVILFGVSCDDSPTSPSDPNVARFTAILLPGNEVPPVTNADASASGTMELRMTVTRDTQNAITGATYDFAVHMTGFPQATTLTGAHIHTGAAGVNGPVVVNLNLAQGEVVLASGQGSIAKTGLSAANAATAASLAQTIFNTPGQTYFNVHTTLNTPGAIRGQLVRTE